MVVEYEITPDDLFAFQWRAAFKSRPARRATRQAYLFWFLALLLISILPAIGGDGFVFSRIDWTFLPGTVLLVFLLQKLLTNWLMRRAIRRMLADEKPGRGQLGRHRVVLQPDAVVESTGVNQTRTSWSGVDRVEQEQEYIFIYTSPMSAHLIPKRAFRDAAEADAFYQLAKARKEAAP
jgi:hypothetical protein